VPTYVLTQNPTTITSSISVTGIGVYGSSGTAWKVVNLSNITATGTGGIGIQLESGGTIANGSSTDTTALIYGAGHAAIEIVGTAGTITNYGTITDPGDSVTFGDGIYLRDGGNITNGSAADTTALIIGDGGLGMGVGGTFYTTILVTNAAGSVTNFATIAPAAGDLAEAVVLEDGGTVVNGPSGASGALIYGLIGVGIAGRAGTVTNFGTIHTKSVGFEGGTGVELGDGGSVTNGSATATQAFIGGYIFNGVNFHPGVEHGVAIGGGAGTMTNFGTVTGITLEDGGQVVNGPSGATGALVDSYYGAVAIEGSLGSVTNFGTIEGYTDGFGAIGVGVYLDFLGSSLVNGASDATTALIKASGSGAIGVDLVASGAVSNFGTIIGPLGISLAAGGTVIDAGTITGSGGTAVSFGGTGASLLEIANGYKLNGSVIGSGSVGASNTLELLGTVSNPVTADYSGLKLSNFQDVLFGSGGNATLDVDATSGTLPITISGFNQTSDVIDLTTIGTNGTIASHTATEVTVTGSLGSVTLTLDGTDAANLTTASDNVNGTDLSIACFRRGTLIRTDRGDVAIEDLALGDRVITLSGEAQPIRWIGRRSYDGRFIAGNRGVLPICISANALADGLPARDLWVSPGHAVLIDSVLVPAEYLLNGATIVQEQYVEQLEYLHIELNEHAILIAEGAPSESYIDCDNRLMFANGAEYEGLYPDDVRPRWAYCAPRLDWDLPELLIAIRARLMDRAAALGHPLTTEPGLRLVADGAIIQPHALGGSMYRFEVPAGSKTLALVSHTAVPAEVDACSYDYRGLGVPVERILLYDGDFSLEAAHSHASLCDGFHQDEATHRWTAGLAKLPDWWARAFAGAFTLEIRLIPSQLCYRLPPAIPQARAG
jgi:hypothetical protein